ncbi:FKBP-type peptidyl-prolyl cis-trans isomerase [uncultured Desulfuromonas sp.]|uniref:FKBP-type peptidyl-prolyl cis-trans isomerase n=1 Tax=uncultured Desulfuromonas sp. TaxID=181013 RepID=UPI002AAC034F|nr:FKBP-type peptidyl-prolyl cis-trans isomerase [uncultured Desulfuromonas sp.]
MQTAQKGDKVSIHYIGTLDNGRIFDSTEGADPLVFTVGAHEVFPLLEDAVIGMRVGLAKNVVIPSDQAYGPRRDENVVVFHRSKLPADMEPTVGQKMQIRLPNSNDEVIMLVTKVEGDEVTLDGNHFLAGLDLTFAIQLDKIEPA